MRPVCAKCGIELECVKNGTLCYHLYQHPKPDAKAREELSDGTVLINTDVLIDGGWTEGDVDFAVAGDKWRCTQCGCEVVTGFGEVMRDYEFKQEFLRKIVAAALKGHYGVEIKR